MRPLPTTIGVWVPIDAEQPMPPPERRPMGRAALQARAQGITVLFGDRWEGPRLAGMVATEEGWVRCTRSVHAIQDRYPAQSRARQWNALHEGARQNGVPVGNSQALTWLCRDKLRCQRALDGDPTIRQPPVVADPDRFAHFQRQWGGAFAKPRYGALGAGVRWVTATEAVPPTLPGVVPGQPDPTLLQWPVPPPAGLSGCVLRVLAQRRDPTPGTDAWYLLPSVLRASVRDRVVNAARGATIAPAEDRLSPVVLDEVRHQVLATCTRLAGRAGDGGLALELGVDVVIDDHLRPWVIEVNSRPRGRLQVLAGADPERFEAARLAAMVRPWVTLARWARRG